MASFTIAHVALLFRKLREVQYEAKHVGINLGLKNGDIEAVCKQSHRTPHECLQDVCTLWLKLLPKQRTWKILVEALRSGREHVIADGIANRYRSTLDQSVSVLLHDLLSLVEGINTTHWRSLGLDLGLPLSQINEIDDRGGWSEYMMIELLRLWLSGNGKPATLDTLVTAVKELPNIDLADRLRADRELHLSLCSDLTPPVAPMEQNIQGRSLKSDGTLELDTSEAVIQQSSNDSDTDSVLESTVIIASNEVSEEPRPYNFLIHSPSDLSHLLQKYNLSQANIEKPCDDHLFLTLLPQLSSLDVTAPYFGLTQLEIEEIRIHKTKERSRKISMLWKWRKRNGSDATYLAIVQVFLRMRNQNLAEVVLQHIKARSQHQPQTINSCVYPEKASSYDNWNRKSAAEKEGIKNRLFEQNENIREKFAYLTETILNSFKSSNVELNYLKLFLFSYGISSNIPTPTNATLLPHFQNATNLEELFLILCRDYASWFNIRLLKVIVKRYGTEEDQKDMKAYEDKLIDYLKRSIFEIPSNSFAPGHENSDLIPLFVLLPDDVLSTAKDLLIITRHLAKLLDISDGILQLRSFENCSILLIFGVPKQLLHNNALRSLVEKYFTYDFVRKGYTFTDDLSLILPRRKYDDDFALKIEPDESIVPHDVPLTSSSNISELSNMDIILTSALKEGGGKLKTCNVVLHGAPGVGKSSLKRLILGYPPLQREQQNATGIIENAVRAVSTNRFTGGRQTLTEVNDVELIKMLAKQVKFLHLSSDTPQDIYSHDSTDQHIPETHTKIPFQPFNTIKNFLFKRKLKSSPLPSTSQLIRVSSSAAMTSIKEQLAEHVEPLNEIYDENWIHLIDSGGCPQFLDVLPLLFHNESLHIVVIRLTEGLDDKPKVRFYNEGKDVYTLPDHLTLSNREIIERACQMAEAVAQATSGKFIPWVMVVGTRKDKLGINSEAKLKEINKELTKVHQKYSRVLIRKSSDEVIFAVNAMAPDGEERQQYTEELQKCILEAVKETGDVIDVPLKWLAFHLDLDKTGGIVRKSECYRIGEIFGMGKSEVENALKFFDKVSLLLYHPDDVPDLVFTKMYPLVNRLSRLIKASFISPGSGPTRESDRLRQKGLFNKSFLSIVFHDLYTSEEKLSDDDFLKLLECLKITVHIGEDEYFLPSALSLEPPSDDTPFPMSCVPLVFTWDERILPHGFFLTFVVEVFQKKRGESFNFELRKDIDQCRDVIQVTVADSKIDIPGFVKLVDKKRWIEICYSCSTTRYCSDLREITSNAVNRVVKRFKHTGMKSPRIGFRCRLCPSNDHYCVLSRDKRMVQCNHRDGPVSPDMLCWIKRPKGTHVPSSSHITSHTTGSHVPSSSHTTSHTTGSHVPSSSHITSHTTGSHVPSSSHTTSHTTGSHYNASSHTTSHTTVPVITTPLKLTTSNTTSSSTGDTSPRDILKRHTSELLGIISDPDKLAVDLWSADLIPDPVKDNVLTTVGLSRLQKSIKLVDEVYRSLKVFNRSDILVKFCEVLNIQHNPGLTRIADEMLKQLSGEF